MSTRTFKRPPTNVRQPRRQSLRDRVAGLWQRVQPADEADDDTEARPGVNWSRILGISAVLSCVLLVGLLALHFDQYTARTQQFHVARFEVVGARRVTMAAVIAASGVVPGSSLLAVDRAVAQRNIEKLPWVRKARVQQVLPNKLVLDVTEYEAYALLLGKRLMLVDRSGHVFKEAEAGDPRDLPILTGLPVEQTRDTPAPVLPAPRPARAEALALAPAAPGTPAETTGQRRLKDLLRLVEAHAMSPLAQRFPLSEVHWDAVLGATLVSAKDGAEVRLGPAMQGDLGRAFAMVGRLLDRVEARDEWLKYAYLDDDLRTDRAVVHAVPLHQPQVAPDMPRAGGASVALLPSAVTETAAPAKKPTPVQPQPKAGVTRLPAPGPVD